MANFNGTKFDDILNGSTLDDVIEGKGGNDTLYGFEGNDLLYGGKGDDFLFGGDGNDTLFGAKGDDFMQGGLGADSFQGGQGTDTVDYSDATSGMTVYVNYNTATGYAAGDTFTNVENLVGGAYDDLLQAGSAGKAFGGGGNDTLFGSNLGTTDGGVIRGDAGYDTLRMDYGDTRAWIQYGQGYDTIKFFEEDSDKLFVDLSEFGLGNTFDSNEIHNDVNGNALGTNAQFVYEDDIGYLWFDSNGSNAGGKSLVAIFDSATITDNNLGTNDFDFQL
jgi:hypothetical protein